MQLVKKNMEKTGARNIVIRCGTAPTGLSEFPPANKVFIGGSTGNLKEIIHSVFSRGTNPVIVMTAVSLETLSQATTLFREMDMETEIICVNVSTAQKLGKYHLMKAENPVYIIRGKKNCNEGQ